MSIDRLGLSRPGAVHLVDRLVEHGLVSRTTSEADRRAVALRLTRSGETVCRAVIAARDGALVRALTILTDQERKTFGMFAEKLLRTFIADVDYDCAVCRPCDFVACTDCPVDAELAHRTTASAITD